MIFEIEFPKQFFLNMISVTFFFFLLCNGEQRYNRDDAAEKTIIVAVKSVA